MTGLKLTSGARMLHGHLSRVHTLFCSLPVKHWDKNRVPLICSLSERSSWQASSRSTSDTAITCLYITYYDSFFSSATCFEPVP
ncbi:hypothetical protein SKAU_G00222110 [Synaphobranchus kaupii]|uniref:Uncharacterized protein n=1 Tax=Synaphobranchus kaupii TaxID=118154 RepID=A0A9Q1FBC1_SYNKA|nr:hypothetical protein SKAU_G00222110 [Synaphobranchus kaupii]